MTLMPKNDVFDDLSETPLDVSSQGMARCLAAYVANPLYRSARFEEMTIEDNPYRRPVRPEDLSFLRFDEPLARPDSSQLSSLIGHRILLNIYDSSRPMAPRLMTAERWRDFELFYSERNRVLGEIVRPFLERHLFGFVRSEAEQAWDPDGAATADGLHAALRALARRRLEKAEGLIAALEGSSVRVDAAKTVAVQLLASTFSAPLRLSTAQVRGSLGVATLPAVRTEEAGAAGVVELRLDDLARSCGLGLDPHRYYQFYLPTTLALMNYVSGAARNPGAMFRHLGAMCARTLDSVALIGGYGARLAELAGGGIPARHQQTAHQDSAHQDSAHQDSAHQGSVHQGSVHQGSRLLAADPGAAVDAAVEAVARAALLPIGERFGPEALRRFGTGLHEYAVLLDVHDGDLATQLAWMDSEAECRAKAERLAVAIEEHAIPVELDTFVESWEECSTTHVHDDDRLLIIESGEMEFWNCFPGTKKFQPGDKLFIPKHRLHGSVVLSGECTYHQPVITPELNRQYG